MFWQLRDNLWRSSFRDSQLVSVDETDEELVCLFGERMIWKLDLGAIYSTGTPMSIVVGCNGTGVIKRCCCVYRTGAAIDKGVDGSAETVDTVSSGDVGCKIHNGGGAGARSREGCDEDNASCELESCDAR